jgi:hypothetical protein
MNALEPIVRALEFGAAKYEPDGWKSVPTPRMRYYDALQRHLLAWWNGEVNDPESGEHHLAHAGCCLVFLLWFETTVHIAKPRVPDLKPEGWNDPRQEPRDSDGREPEMTDDMQDDMQDGSRVIGYVPREDVGFALTDAEAAEAERAGTPTCPECLYEHRTGNVAPVDHSCEDDNEPYRRIGHKPRPEGRGHLPIAYELDRAEAITARLRKENAQLKESFANLRKAHEENEDAVTKLQIEADTDYADAQANLDIEKKAHEITRGMLAASAQRIVEFTETVQRREQECLATIADLDEVNAELTSMTQSRDHWHGRHILAGGDDDPESEEGAIQSVVIPSEP